MFLFCDSLIVFDHTRHTIKVIAHCRVDGDIDAAYAEAGAQIEEIVERLHYATITLPEQEVAEVLRVNGKAAEQRGPRRLRADGRADPRVRHRGRRHPDRAVTTAGTADGGAPVQHLPAAADRGPLAVHVLCGYGRLSDRRRLAGAAGACRGRRSGHASDRRHAQARRAHRKKTSGWPWSFSATRRSAPSTSCWWTSAGTTLGGLRRQAPST